MAIGKELGASRELTTTVNTPLSDDELMERLKMGDALALGPLYERHRGKVSAVLHHQVGRLSASDREDLCHDVFMTLMETARRFRPGHSVPAWLCGIALRKARRLRYGQWLRRNLLEPFRRAPPAAADPAAPLELGLDVQKALEQLSPPLREVVVLSFVEQLSTEDIATALGVNVKTVWTRLHRARTRLKEVMDDGGKP
jgi:RNA polymerase sigma-70 factor (ECF subfamily)